ncbi:MAG: hypothetical protein U5L45_18850 [Saprospiraceae bacterium]|nr:hypothetical protein [Saprospiraceae bacterium]
MLTHFLFLRLAVSAKKKVFHFSGKARKMKHTSSLVRAKRARDKFLQKKIKKDRYIPKILRHLLLSRQMASKIILKLKKIKV